MVIILQLLLLEKYRGPDLGDLNGRYGPGRDRIRYNELRRENWTSRRFNTDYFNIEYLFWT